MQLNLTEDQFRALVRQLAIANMAYGKLMDAYVTDDFAQLYDENEDLMTVVKGAAADFGAADLVEEVDGNKFLTEPTYENAFEHLLALEDDSVISTLSDHFAREEMRQQCSLEEWEALTREERAEKLDPLLDRFEDLFEERYFECLRLEDDCTE